MRVKIAKAACLSRKWLENPSLLRRHESCSAKRVQSNISKVFVHALALVVTTLFGFSGMGCSSQGGASTQPMTNPASTPPPRYGISQDRATTALQRLRPAFTGDAVVCVSKSVIPSASSWSDGTIYLSTGLLRILDDDEVVAAVAHELGHITHASDACVRQIHALDGSRDDVEQAADAAAIEMLRRSGVPLASLSRVLMTVRDLPETRRELRPAITRRIELLPRE
jgi:hypothetical protein